MKETSKCINGHSNPIDAQYCGLCGAPIARNQIGFTPDLYPDIHLVPISIKKIKFVKGGEVFSLIIIPICIIALFILYDVFESEIDDFMEDIWDGLGAVIFLSLIAILLIIGALRGLKHIIDSAVFKCNADYIEETNLELAKIAKDGKLGLFNQVKKELLLLPRYDKIEKFDSKHIMIGQDRFVGLYSVPHKKVIVPVECDSISSEKDGVIEVSNKGTLQHYDVLGNKLH